MNGLEVGQVGPATWVSWNSIILVKSWDNHSSRWHLTVALWETLSQCGPSPDPPLLYPSCLVLGVQYLECSSLTPFSHHQTTVYLQSGINSFWPCPTLRVLFISPVGKTCSQEMTMSKLVPECWIPDIRKPRGRYVFGGGWEGEVIKFHRSSDVL